VDAARVERVLQQFPAIGAAVVLGVPDPDWGERVVAAVETAQRLDEQALKAWVAAHLAAYERPKQVLICPATKIDAKRLAAAFAQQSSFLLPFS